MSNKIKYLLFYVLLFISKNAFCYTVSVTDTVHLPANRFPAFYINGKSDSFIVFSQASDIFIVNEKQKKCVTLHFEADILTFQVGQDLSFICVSFFNSDGWITEKIHSIRDIDLFRENHVFGEKYVIHSVTFFSNEDKTAYTGICGNNFILSFTPQHMALDVRYFNEEIANVSFVGTNTIVASFFNGNSQQFCLADENKYEVYFRNFLKVNEPITFDILPDLGVTLSFFKERKLLRIYNEQIKKVWYTSKAVSSWKLFTLAPGKKSILIRYDDGRCCLIDPHLLNKSVVGVKEELLESYAYTGLLIIDQERSFCIFDNSTGNLVFKIKVTGGKTLVLHDNTLAHSCSVRSAQILTTFGKSQNGFLFVTFDDSSSVLINIKRKDMYPIASIKHISYAKYHLLKLFNDQSFLIDKEAQKVLCILSLSFARDLQFFNFNNWILIHFLNVRNGRREARIFDVKEGRLHRAALLKPSPDERYIAALILGYSPFCNVSSIKVFDCQDKEQIMNFEFFYPISKFSFDFDAALSKYTITLHSSYIASCAAKTNTIHLPTGLNKTFTVDNEGRALLAIGSRCDFSVSPYVSQDGSSEDGIACSFMNKKRKFELLQGASEYSQERKRRKLNE